MIAKQHALRNKWMKVHDSDCEHAGAVEWSCRSDFNCVQDFLNNVEEPKKDHTPGRLGPRRRMSRADLSQIKKAIRGPVSGS